MNYELRTTNKFFMKVVSLLVVEAFLFTSTLPAWALPTSHLRPSDARDGGIGKEISQEFREERPEAAQDGEIKVGQWAHGPHGAGKVISIGKDPDYGPVVSLQLTDGRTITYMGPSVEKLSPGGSIGKEEIDQLSMVAAVMDTLWLWETAESHERRMKAIQKLLASGPRAISLFRSFTKGEKLKNILSYLKELKEDLKDKNATLLYKLLKEESGVNVPWYSPEMAWYEIVETLRTIGPPAIPTLRSALKGGYPRVRAAALKLLIEFEAPDLLPDLVESLKDRSRYVRESAAEALVGMGASAAPALVETLKDESQPAREAALQLLLEIDPQRVIPALTANLKDKNASVRLTAVKALGDLGGPRVISFLAEALKDRSRHVRESAAEALVGMGASAAPALVEAVGTKRAVEITLDIMEQQRGSKIADRAIEVLIGISPPVATIVQRFELADRQVLIQALDLDIVGLVDLLKDRPIGIGALAALTTHPEILSKLVALLKGPEAENANLRQILRLLAIKAISYKLRLEGKIPETLSPSAKMYLELSVAKHLLEDHFLKEEVSEEIITVEDLDREEVMRDLDEYLEGRVKEVQETEKVFQNAPTIGGKLYARHARPEEKMLLVLFGSLFENATFREKGFLQVPHLILPYAKSYEIQAELLSLFSDLVLPERVLEARYDLQVSLRERRRGDLAKYIALARMILNPFPYDLENYKESLIGGITPIVYDGAILPPRTDFLTERLIGKSMVLQEETEASGELLLDALAQLQLLTVSLQAYEKAKRNPKEQKLAEVWEEFQKGFEKLLRLERYEAIHPLLDEWWIKEAQMSEYGFKVNKEILPYLKELEALKWTVQGDTIRPSEEGEMLIEMVKTFLAPKLDQIEEILTARDGGNARDSVDQIAFELKDYVLHLLSPEDQRTALIALSGAQDVMGELLLLERKGKLDERPENQERGFQIALQIDGALANVPEELRNRLNARIQKLGLEKYDTMIILAKTFGSLWHSVINQTAGKNDPASLRIAFEKVFGYKADDQLFKTLFGRSRLIITQNDAQDGADKLTAGDGGEENFGLSADDLRGLKYLLGENIPETRREVGAKLEARMTQGTTGDSTFGPKDRELAERILDALIPIPQTIRGQRVPETAWRLMNNYRYRTAQTGLLEATEKRLRTLDKLPLATQPAGFIAIRQEYAASLKTHGAAIIEAIETKFKEIGLPGDVAESLRAFKEQVAIAAEAANLAKGGSDDELVVYRASASVMQASANLSSALMVALRPSQGIGQDTARDGGEEGDQRLKTKDQKFTAARDGAGRRMGILPRALLATPFFVSGPSFPQSVTTLLSPTQTSVLTVQAPEREKVASFVKETLPHFVALNSQGRSTPQFEAQMIQTAEGIHPELARFTRELLRLKANPFNNSDAISKLISRFNLYLSQPSIGFYLSSRIGKNVETGEELFLINTLQIIRREKVVEDGKEVEILYVRRVDTLNADVAVKGHSDPDEPFVVVREDRIDEGAEDILRGLRGERMTGINGKLMKSPEVMSALQDLLKRIFPAEKSAIVEATRLRTKLHEVHHKKDQHKGRYEHVENHFEYSVAAETAAYLASAAKHPNPGIPLFDVMLTFMNQASRGSKYYFAKRDVLNTLSILAYGKGIVREFHLITGEGFEEDAKEALAVVSKLVSLSPDQLRTLAEAALEQHEAYIQNLTPGDDHVLSLLSSYQTAIQNQDMDAIVKMIDEIEQIGNESAVQALLTIVKINDPTLIDYTLSALERIHENHPKLSGIDTILQLTERKKVWNSYIVHQPGLTSPLQHVIHKAQGLIDRLAQTSARDGGEEIDHRPETRDQRLTAARDGGSKVTAAVRAGTLAAALLTSPLTDAQSAQSKGTPSQAEVSIPSQKAEAKEILGQLARSFSSRVAYSHPSVGVEWLGNATRIMIDHFNDQEILDVPFHQIIRMNYFYPDVQKAAFASLLEIMKARGPQVRRYLVDELIRLMEHGDQGNLGADEPTVDFTFQLLRDEARATGPERLLDDETVGRLRVTFDRVSPKIHGKREFEAKAAEVEAMTMEEVVERLKSSVPHHLELVGKIDMKLLNGWEKQNIKVPDFEASKGGPLQWKKVEIMVSVPATDPERLVMAVGLGVYDKLIKGTPLAGEWSKLGAGGFPFENEGEAASLFTQDYKNILLMGQPVHTFWKWTQLTGSEEGYLGGYDVTANVNARLAFFAKHIFPASATARDGGEEIDHRPETIDQRLAAARDGAVRTVAVTNPKAIAQHLNLNAPVLRVYHNRTFLESFRVAEQLAAEREFIPTFGTLQSGVRDVLVLQDDVKGDFFANTNKALARPEVMKVLGSRIEIFPSNFALTLRGDVAKTPVETVLTLKEMFGENLRIELIGPKSWVDEVEALLNQHAPSSEILKVVAASETPLGEDDPTSIAQNLDPTRILVQFLEGTRGLLEHRATPIENDKAREAYFWYRSIARGA